MAPNVGTSGSISTEQAALPPRNNHREVQTAPNLVILSLPVVSGEIPLSTKRTFILMPGIRTSLDPKVGYTVRIVVEAVRFYNCVLDIEQFPA